MPDARQEPHDHEVKDDPPFGGNAGAAEREIYIIPEPVSQRDMPSSPEFRHGFGNIGIIKILLKLKTEHLCQSDRHIGITAEIVIDLERVADRPDPGHQHGVLICRKGYIRRIREHIRHQHLLIKTDQES